MLSIVNYGSSDDENEITDDEEEQTSQVKLDNYENGDLQDLSKPLSAIKLPEPVNREIIEEDDDEFLHKKEIPAAKPPPPPKVKERVKIMIPKLSDFKDDEEDEGLAKKYPTAPNKKAGLLGMLPKPTHSILLPAKPVPSTITTTFNAPPKSTVTPEMNNPLASSSSQDPPKKVGLIPYALMDHKKAADIKKLAKKKSGDDDESDSDEESTSFFTFSKDEDLPQVNEEEIKSLIARETNRIEQRKRQNEEPQDSLLDNLNHQYTLLERQQQDKANIDRIAMEALMGGSKAKRSKLEDIKIVDLDDKDVLPDREEWIRRTLSGETSYIPTGQIDEKGPNALAKRKHQLSYLSLRAEKNTSELEAMWAANRQSNREGRSKYGF